MGSICIVTDNTAQFSQPAFPGRNLVHILPTRIFIMGEEITETQPIKASGLPDHITSPGQISVKPPGVEDFQKLFNALEPHFSEIFVILPSIHLINSYEIARAATRTFHGSINLHVIDSQTTSIGLGYLVQTAADAAASGATPIQIDQLVRSTLSRIYAVLCTPSLSYLHNTGIIDSAQAVIGEMLAIFPIFTLEEGEFTPVDKVRNHRHIIEFFEEFLDEFESLQHIGLLQSKYPNNQETRIFREHVQTSFPKIPFTEHTINTALASLMGPTCTGLFLVESGTRKIPSF